MTKLVDQNTPAALVGPTVRPFREENLGPPNPAGDGHHGSVCVKKSDLSTKAEHTNDLSEQSRPACVVHGFRARDFDFADGPTNEEPEK